MNCTIDGCTNRTRSGKVCSKHRERIRKYGDPHANHRLKAVLRFTVNDEGCHIWDGEHKKPDGYGVVKVAGRRIGAHRWAWEMVNGHIPDGLTIDHTCHNKALADGRCQPGACRHRACVNVDHMELAGAAENSRRGKRASTHCRQGHEFDDVNTQINTKGHRVCRACRKLRRQERGSNWATQLGDAEACTERCPECWGEGGGPAWPQDDSWCRRCEGTGRCQPYPADEISR